VGRGTPQHHAVGLCVRPGRGLRTRRYVKPYQVWVPARFRHSAELVTQDGRFADHYPGRRPGRIPGWHVIAAGITGWGTGQCVQQTFSAGS